MIVITCNACKESFNIHEKHMISKTELKCPSCEKLLDSEVVKLLSEYAQLSIDTDIKFKDADKRNNSGSKLLNGREYPFTIVLKQK